MDWLVFGDDFGVHPSTTQHLIRHLPSEDRVLWVHSVGMRKPRLKDAFSLLKRWKHTRARTSQSHEGPHITTLRLAVLPWHEQRALKFLNAIAAEKQLTAKLAELDFKDVHLLSATPIAGSVTSKLQFRTKSYLRLDHYSELPGVDGDMLSRVEPRFIDEVSLVVHPAACLAPSGLDRAKALHLPQGVDVNHFAKTRLQKEPTKVLGFFGLIASWLDHDLIAEVAMRNPDWTFEFRGALAKNAEKLPMLPNIRVLPAIPYSDLPDVITHWQAAWIPFEQSTLTLAVDPLKAREYLAAGLPVATTPLPALQEIAEIHLIPNASCVSAWLKEIAEEGAATGSLQRRNSVTSHDWSKRSEVLRTAVSSLRH
ncbi:MAG: glycosyltransferase family 1 protein [Deltaproteobacteria bacterium]|nr:glycosyltransferase family 1 protein [Deltaproteobacteria bacterium]